MINSDELFYSKNICDELQGTNYMLSAGDTGKTEDWALNELTAC